MRRSNTDDRRLILELAAACLGGFLLACAVGVLTGCPSEELDPLADDDGDGIPNDAELLGYEIFVDFSGFGLSRPAFLERRLVTSDPLLADTDGDGIDDAEEQWRKSDPRRADTDNDGLSDRDELRRWGTSPVSVDTDADARSDDGDTPPDPALFDAAELNLRDIDGTLWPGVGATNPASADTDGDGVSDRTELGNPLRHPAIADTPRVSIEVVDEVSVWLDVEYTDAVGTTESYGGSGSVGTSRSESSTDSRVGEWSLEGSVTGKIGFDISTSPGVTFGVGFGVTVGGGATWSGETTRTLAENSSREWSEEQSESQSRTISVAEGRMSAGIRLINDGDIAYEIRDLAIGVRQLKPDGTYRSVAAMQPADGFDSFTLAQGADSGIVFFGAQGIQPDTIRDFLRRPAGLLLEPTDFKLVDSSGTSFVFVAEEAYGRTAQLVVDWSDGTVDRWRMASNVDRPADGGVIGVRLLDMLGLGGYDADLDANVLHALNGVASEVYESAAPDLADPPYLPGTEPGERMTRGMWGVVVSRYALPEDAENPEEIDLTTVRLLPRDAVYAAWLFDGDRDGISSREEYLRGTSDLFVDSDGTEERPEGDGLSDWFELRSGWEVAVVGAEPYVALPNPVLLDSDGDGCHDDVEYGMGTDPTLPDTDGDGVADCDANGPLDPTPLDPETEVAR